MDRGAGSTMLVFVRPVSQERGPSRASWADVGGHGDRRHPWRLYHPEARLNTILGCGARMDGMDGGRKEEEECAPSTMSGKGEKKPSLSKENVALDTIANSHTNATT